jgi:hypothetical protein
MDVMPGIQHDISKEQAMSPKINGDIGMKAYENEVNDAASGSTTTLKDPSKEAGTAPPPEDDPNLVVIRSPDPPPPPPSSGPTLQEAS